MTMRMRPPGDGDLPDIDEDALECLVGASLASFTASPSTLRPFGGSATLRWSVSVPTGCRVGFAINGRSVSRSGTLEVLPAVTTRYTLTASVRGASRVLGSRVIEVDTSACMSGELGEAVLRAQIEGAVASFVAGDERAYDLSLTSFDVRSTGLAVSLKMKLEIDNFVDPDVYVDFVIGLSVEDGQVRPYYRSFTVDVDWPWWVTALTIGVTKIVEEFVDGSVEGDMKPKVLNEVRDVVDSLVALLPEDMRVHSIRLTDDAVVVTACPEGDGLVPARVLAVTIRERALGGG